MSRKQKFHKPIKSTFDEVLNAVASNPFDEKKRKTVTKKFKKTPPKKAE